MRARVGPDAVFVVVASLVFTAFPALSFNPAHAATTCQGLPPTIIGTPGNDAIDGTSADDVIVGRGGDDVINGSGGDDVICGNAGDDTLLGGAGVDRLSGDSGDDSLFGEEGDDLLSGGTGDDDLSGGTGDDDLSGGTGDDDLDGGDGDDDLDGGPGFNRLDGGAGTDLCINGPVITNCEEAPPPPTPEADLAIDMSDFPDPVTSGSELTYTLFITNTVGPNTAPNIVVTDDMPAETDPSSSSATPGVTCDLDGTREAAEVICTAPQLAVGDVITIDIVADVDVPSTPATIQNTATVTSDAFDPNPGNNTDTEQTSVMEAADLVVVDPDDSDPVAPGGTIVYDISVTNLGPDAALSTTLTVVPDPDVSLDGTSSLAYLLEDFDAVSPPALPPGWAAEVAGTAPPWATTGAVADSSPNSAFAPDHDSTADNLLFSPPVFIGDGDGRLRFRNRFSFEEVAGTTFFDGGVLEISIAGGPFVDILAAGGSFTAGGYSGTINGTTNNPLAGRPGWVGTSGGFITTVVTLPAAATGEEVRLRWRLGTDINNSLCDTAGECEGWNVDSVRVEATTAPCAASGSDLDCNLGDLEAGQEVVVAVTGMVSASPNLLLTNRVRASSATFDPDEDNNFDAEFTCTNASCFVTTLSGANEVPPVTTPGSGKAQVAIDTATDEVCWGYLVRGLTSPVVGAHIHDGDVGVNGPIVVDLSSPAPDADGVSTGCVVDPDGDAIAADPTGHYINVHTTMNPGGEVRGQLAAPL